MTAEADNLVVEDDGVQHYFRSICTFYDDDVWVADHPANVAHAARGVTGTYVTRKAAV